MSNELEPVYAEDAAAIEAAGGVNDSFFNSITGQTPWWIVSVMLHALVITLAGLLSMVIEMPDNEGMTLQVTEFYQQKQIQQEQREPQPKAEDVLNNEHRVTETDKNGVVMDRDVVIPEEIIREAELSDHFETVNPDRPDTQSAFGNPKSEFFYLAQGNNEDRGGGGQNGAGQMADVIGLAGEGSAGTGGGFGGGNGNGIGLGNGDCKGSFAIRLDGGGRKLRIARMRGSSPQAEQALKRALQWLAYHQEADGHWDAKKYESGVKTDTAITGLALLTFLGAGHTEKVGEFHGNVQKAVAWLKSKQAADGCIWDTSDDGAGHRRVGYPSAIATLAMAEAAGMANIADTKAAAQKAIDYCTEIHQFGEGYDKLGWRYAPKSEGDLSVSGWFIMALKSAKVAGLKVSPAAFEGAIKFLDSVEVKDADNSGYPASHYKYMASNEHGQTAHRLTAIGTLARQFMGWKKDDLQGSVDWFVNKGGVPNAGANGESVDLYYWYYGSMCVFQQGGQVWDKWNAGMLKSLLGTQCAQGDANGSWNPTGEFSGEWGRVGQTALSALCLEVYYRYDLIKSGK